MTTLAPEQIRAYQAKAWADPVGWLDQACGVRLWSKQRAIAEAVRDHPMVAVRSGNGVGKSYLSAGIALAYSEAHCPSYVVDTASSWKGVEKTFWPTLKRIVRQAPLDLGGDLQTTQWKRDDLWGVFGVSCDNNEPENISGFRTPHGAMVIVDEASALTEDIYDAILGLCSTEGSRIFLIGNPLRPEGPFYECFKSPAWKTFAISTWENPNVVENREVIPGLSSRAWCEERLAEWGADHPAYLARVLGQFPESAEDVLIPLAWVEAALERGKTWKPDRKRGPTGEVKMGGDVARFGADRSTLVARDERIAFWAAAHAKEDIMQTAGRVKKAAEVQAVAPGNIFIDDTGLGGGVVDRLKEQRFMVRAVNFGAAAKDAEQFANARAEAYWRLRMALSPEADNPLSIADTPELRRMAYELPMAHYKFTSAGKIILEPKEDIKKRLGKSPDLADALAQTYAHAPLASMRGWEDLYQAPRREGF